MKQRSNATRYARALEAALDGPDGNDAIARSADDLAVVASVIDSDPAIPEALANPAVTLEQKQALLRTLARHAGLSETTQRLLTILSEKDALAEIPEIARAMERIRDRRLGIVEATVTTATPLAPDMAERAKQTLETTTGREVRLSLRTDPALIGGMVARVGSTVYDGSIRTRLAAMREQIAR